MAEFGLYLNAGTIVAVVGATAGIVWKLSRIEKEVREHVADEIKEASEHAGAQIDNVERDLANLERDSIARADTLRRETGEMGLAIRQKIHDVEVFNRDTFVRVDSFELVIGRIEKSIEKLGDRLESKVDRVVDRLQQHRKADNTEA